MSDLRDTLAWGHVRRRLAIAVFLVVTGALGGVASADGDQLVHRSPLKWSMRVPKGWERYPIDVLRQREKETAEAMGVAPIEHEAGFGPKGSAPFTPPYLLVRTNAGRQSPTVFDNVSDQLVRDAKAGKAEAAGSRIGLSFDVGVTRRLARKDAIVVTAAFTTADGEKLKAVGLTFAGRDALAFVNFYLQDTGLDAGLPLIADAVESFVFEPGSGLWDPQPSTSELTSERSAATSEEARTKKLAVDGAPSRFQSAGRWSVNVPASWTRIPTKAVDDLDIATANLTGKPRRNWEAMFGRPDRAPLALPYVAFASTPLGAESPHSVLAELTGPGFEQAIGAEVAGAASTVSKRATETTGRDFLVSATAGRVQRLPGLPGVLLRSSQQVPGKNPSTYVMVILVGRASVAFIHFSVSDEEFDSESDNFRAILDSFSFDPGFGIDDAPPLATPLEPLDDALARRLGASAPSSRAAITDRDVARKFGAEPPSEDAGLRSTPDRPTIPFKPLANERRELPDWLAKGDRGRTRVWNLRDDSSAMDQAGATADGW